MIDKCSPSDYNFTYTMVEVANAISTAPEPATAGAGKGHSPKDGRSEAVGSHSGTVQNMQRTVIRRMKCLHGAI